MDNREKICRFCFEKCDTNYKAIEGSMYEILSTLLVTMNLAISDEPVMCTDCSEIIQNCFVFKKKCLNIRDRAVAFGSDKNNGHAVCEFCMNILRNCPFKILDGEEDIEKTMLQKYFPELDLSASKKLAICEVCHGCLANFFSFITNSSIVEEKIKEYCQAEGVNNTDTIKLNNVLKFTSENVWKENDNLLDVFKMEDTVSVKSENKDLSVIKEPVACASCHGSLEDCSHFTMNRATVKEKLKKCFETRDIHSEEVSSSLGLTIRDVTKREVDGIIKVEEQFCEDGKYPGEIEIGDCRGTVKLEQLFLDDSHGGIKDVEYIFVDSNKFSSVKAEETFCEETGINTNEDYFNRFGCDMALSQSGFKKHLLVDKDSSAVTIYKCDSCLYVTKYKNNLKVHLMLHKNPSEVTMYKCDSCSFETKHKISLKYHLLKHKDPSEVTMYKCDSCSFETKHKLSLKYHSMRHKDPSEVKMYKCDSCSFETKRKSILVNHLLRHKDPSEITMYKCNICLYQTKYKTDLKKHQILHKDPSDMTMYKCDSCLFQTKHKLSLKYHLLKHKDPSEVTMYKCDSCSFETKHKSILVNHSLTHKDPSEITMYKCDSCSFETKHKCILVRHLLRHRDPSKTTMYKCDSCLYQAKYKNNLKAHQMLHKNLSEIEMYECSYCSFQTKFKGNLKIHLLTHKDPSEVTMYKCDSCSFETKRKYNLKHHLLTHKHSSAVM